MKYLMASTVAIAAVAAIWLIVAGTGGGTQSGPPAGAILPTGAPAIRAEAQATPDLARLTSRETLIASARTRAEMDFGGSELQLMRVEKTTVRELARLPGWTQEDVDVLKINTDLTTDDAPVYVVQLRGTFQPSTRFRETPTPPQPNMVMTAVFDAKTGRMPYSGLSPASPGS